MGAAKRRKYGSTLTIEVENMAQPIPKENEVAVQVFVTAVNRTDFANLTAIPFIIRLVLGFLNPQKVILGADFAAK